MRAYHPSGFLQMFSVGCFQMDMGCKSNRLDKHSIWRLRLMFSSHRVLSVAPSPSGWFLWLHLLGDMKGDKTASQLLVKMLLFRPDNKISLISADSASRGGAAPTSAGRYFGREKTTAAGRRWTPAAGKPSSAGISVLSKSSSVGVQGLTLASPLVSDTLRPLHSPPHQEVSKKLILLLREENIHFYCRKYEIKHRHRWFPLPHISRDEFLFYALPGYYEYPVVLTSVYWTVHICKVLYCTLGFWNTVS